MTMATKNRRQAATILTLLYLGYLLSFGGRVIFSLALKPIKTTLELSDSQLGFLSGLLRGKLRTF